MRCQARSSARVKILGGTLLRFAGVICVFACVPATCRLGAASQDAAKSSRSETYRIRFQVVDSTNSRGIPHAAAALVLWQKKESGDEKKELEGKTDENGFVEFPPAEAQMFAITVTMKGYRSCWRWIRGRDRLKQLSLIKLEPWISAQK